jgi:zinc/manganese transport system ATP-binding protein
MKQRMRKIAPLSSTERIAEDRTGDAVLEVRGVSVRFGARDVLRNVNFVVREGEFMGFIGPNGAGKTTLLRVILGLLMPTSGSVHIDGLPARHGNSFVGYVPQKIQLEPDTPMRARDLVSLGLDGHRFGVPLPSKRRRLEVDAALAAVHAQSFADAPVGRLSGGEQQRLLIAQALLTKPKLLLLDEPLSNLDIRSAHEVVNLVAEIAKEQHVAVMLVAHDMNPLLGVMDRIVYLADGKALMGPVDQVVQSSVLSQLYGYPVEVLRVKGRILVVGGPGTEASAPEEEPLSYVE